MRKAGISRYTTTRSNISPDASVAAQSDPLSVKESRVRLRSGKKGATP